MVDQRNFDRVPFNVKVSFLPQKKYFEVKLLDISIRGAMIEGEVLRQLELNAEGTLKIALVNSDITLKMDSEIVRKNKSEVGLKFKQMESETFSHLKRLVELNSGKTISFPNPN